MWKFLSRLVSNSAVASRSAEGQHLSTPSNQTQQATTEDPLDVFWSTVAPLSSTEYRFLHPNYSPGSRVPCADFTTFIVDRLYHHDTVSIKSLMRAAIAGNPGVGIGPEWIDKEIDEISSLDFHSYCESASADFLIELKALFILASKDGGQRHFWIAEEKPLLFALALCCHEVHWLEEMGKLRDEANLVVTKMRKNTPFWRDYSLFDGRTSELTLSHYSSVTSVLRAIPLLARMQLLHICEKTSASLMQATTYPMRSLGLNPLETAPLLLSCGMCELETDLESIADILSKNDLVATLEERSVPYRKSWKKIQLVKALWAHSPEVITKFSEREKIARIRPEFSSGLQVLSAYANGMQENIKLLCFVGHNL